MYRLVILTTNFFKLPPKCAVLKNHRGSKIFFQTLKGEHTNWKWLKINESKYVFKSLTNMKHKGSLETLKKSIDSNLFKFAILMSR